MSRFNFTFFYAARRVIAGTALSFQKNKLRVYSASCTYYFLVSLMPCVMLASYFTVNYAVSLNTELFSGIPFYEELEKLVSSLKRPKQPPLKALGIAGLLYAIWTSSSLMGGIMSAFRSIFTGATRTKKILSTLFAHAIIPLFILAILLAATLGMSLASLLKAFAANTLHLNELLAARLYAYVHWAGIFLIMCALFSGFVFLAPKPPTKKSALAGAVLFGLYFFGLQKAALFTMGAFVLRYALYGALGSLMLVLLWVYLIFFGFFLTAQFVAELDKIYADKKN